MTSPDAPTPGSTSTVTPAPTMTSPRSSPQPPQQQQPPPPPQQVQEAAAGAATTADAGGDGGASGGGEPPADGGGASGGDGAAAGGGPGHHSGAGGGGSGGGGAGLKSRLLEALAAVEVPDGATVAATGEELRRMKQACLTACGRLLETVQLAGLQGAVRPVRALIGALRCGEDNGHHLDLFLAIDYPSIRREVELRGVEGLRNALQDFLDVKL